MRVALRAVLLLSSASLLAAGGRVPMTLLETHAAATSDASPDRLYLAIDVATEQGAPASATVDDADVEAVLRRVIEAGIPAEDVVQHDVVAVADRWKSQDPDFENHPYGVILLRFSAPARETLEHVRNAVLAKALSPPIRNGVYAEAGAAWYELDDCRKLQNASQQAATQLAEDAATHLGYAAGFTLDVTGVKLEPPAQAGWAAAEPYLCGAKSLPDVPPAGIEPLLGEDEQNGRVSDESTVAALWPTLPLGLPTPLPHVPRGLTSNRAALDVPTERLEDGTLIAAVSVANDAIGGPHRRCPRDAAMPYALALAEERASALGSLVGLTRGSALTIEDPFLFQGDACTASPPGPLDPPSAAAIETFAALGGGAAAVGRRLTVEGHATVAVPADVARIVARFAPARNGALPDGNDVRARLAASGIDAATLRLRSGKTMFEASAYVPHPTRATMSHIASAIVAIAGRSGTHAWREADYAVNDCYALDRLALRAAVDAASGVALAKAQGDRVALGHVIAAEDEGIPPERNCGPGVLGKLPANELVPAGTQPLGDPLASATETVRLVYRVDAASHRP